MPLPSHRRPARVPASAARAAAVAVLAGAALLPAAASAQVAAAAPAPRAWHGVLGGALTAGGEKLVSVPLSDGSTRSVSTGGLVDVWAGVEFRPAAGPVSVLATLGWHGDCVCARNGDVTFSRVPLELIAMVDLAPRWRAGLGYRHASEVRLRSSGSAPGYAQDFDAANGVILQGEWMATPRLGVVVRAVSEKYGYRQTYVNASDQIATLHLSRDGTHGGVGLNWYF